MEKGLLYESSAFFSNGLPKGQAGWRPETFIPQQTFPGCRSMFDQETRKTLNEEDALFKLSWNKVLPVSSSRLHWVLFSHSHRGSLCVSNHFLLFLCLFSTSQCLNLSFGSAVYLVHLHLSVQTQKINLACWMTGWTDTKEPHSHVWAPVLITSGSFNCFFHYNKSRCICICFLGDPQPSVWANFM